MTKMPVLDKGFATQNILSAKGTQPVLSNGGEDFGAVLKQAGGTKQDTSDRTKTETAKASEPVEETKGNALRDKLNGKEKPEETTKTAETEKTDAASEAEDIAGKEEILEEAGGEMAAAIAAQLEIPVETVREAMDDLQMTDVSLLQPENVKDLMTYLTDGADSMSMLTDGNFYQSVTEALETLEGILNEAAQETGMEPETLQTIAQGMETRTIPETVQEEAVETAGNAQENEEPVNLSAEKPELTESARTETVAPRETKQEDSKDSTGSFMQDHYQNPTVQQNPAERAVQTEQAVFTADTQEIMDQIMDYMKVAVKPEVTDLEMQLHPESLGNLHIHLSSKEGAVTAQFIAQNESVRAALESQVVELRQNLEEQGIKVEAVEVTVAQYSLDRETGREGTSSEQDQKQKRGIRNLNLAELDPEEEELTEEEKLAAEMMKSEGSTISYTA